MSGYSTYGDVGWNMDVSWSTVLIAIRNWSETLNFPANPISDPLWQDFSSALVLPLRAFCLRFNGSPSCSCRFAAEDMITEKSLRNLQDDLNSLHSDPAQILWEPGS